MLSRIYAILLLSLCAANTGRAQYVPPVQKIQHADSLAARVPRPSPAGLKYSYYRELGAACKVEWKLEKATKVPLRLRLGSLQQTDYLEQKPNAQRPQ